MLKSLHADLSTMLRDLGEDVNLGTYSAKGLLSREPTEVLQMDSKTAYVQATVLTVLIIENSLGTLTNNASITAEGKNYKIEKFIKMDGGLQKIWLVGA